MSRCFPFPPPGYEPKYRIEDIQKLKKEKDREKKHKKEKEKKREGKEKRDKERSDGKHKESKEKKEKHKDKKKDKEKGGDKHKVSTPDKKRLQQQSEVQREEKISNQKQHLAHAEGSGGEKIVYKQDRKKDRISLSAEKRHAGSITGPITGYDEDGIGNNSNRDVVKVSRSVQELGKTARGGIRESGNQLLGKKSGTGHNKDQVKLAPRPSEICADQKNNRTRVDDRQIDGKGFSNQPGYLGHTAVQNLAESVQAKTADMHVSSEKYTGKKMEIKEKNKENGGSNKYGDVHVNRDRENKVQGLRIGDKVKREKPKEKDEDVHVSKDRENKALGLRIGDEEKQEKLKEKNEHQPQLQDESRESNHCGLLGSQHTITPHLAKDSKWTGAVDGSAKKRKHPDANGNLHAKDKRSSKVQRPTPQNGSSLRDSQTAISSTNKRHGIATERTVINKEQKFNGVQEAPLTLSVPVRTSPATVQNCSIVENNVKSPHPDLEHLSKLLVVPEMEELPNADDEEWLFSNSHVESEKLNEKLHETPQVWAEALQIDSPDFWALPYVIPY